MEIFRIGFLAITGKDSERKGGNSLHGMKHSIHEELDATCDLTKFSDNQFIFQEIEMIKHIFLEIMDIIFVVVIGIITDDNMRICDKILQKTGTFCLIKQREFCRRIREKHNKDELKINKAWR